MDAAYSDRRGEPGFDSVNAQYPSEKLMRPEAPELAGALKMKEEQTDGATAAYE